MRQLLDRTNDLGLLSEEYDPVHERMVGNYPQAFSHLALVGAAIALAGEQGPPGKGQISG
jgi:GH15 family glucan-1,4-alpha-glucosidase